MLERIDLSQKLTREEYTQALVHYQLQLRELAYQLYVRKRSLVIVFEGWDAAGKGGTIKRITERLDPRGYEVLPIAAPVGEDRTHHYTWRFWRRLVPPDEKQVLIFDRSWYGRVLVERIEGFCQEAEWRRAYREINEFERQLVDFGIIVAKFWMHISQEEQLRRFEQRQDTPYKSWKLTEEDWRNRDKWSSYKEAVEDMLLKTSTLAAPWTIIESNDKWFGRVKTLRSLVETLSKELGQTPPPSVGVDKKRKQGRDKKSKGQKKAK
jgi:polyphosphate kinase 2 (PPK2 family)